MPETNPNELLEEQGQSEAAPVTPQPDPAVEGETNQAQEPPTESGAGEEVDVPDWVLSVVADERSKRQKIEDEKRLADEAKAQALAELGALKPQFDQLKQASEVWPQVLQERDQQIEREVAQQAAFGLLQRATAALRRGDITAEQFPDDSVLERVATDAVIRHRQLQATQQQARYLNPQAQAEQIAQHLASRFAPSSPAQQPAAAAPPASNQSAEFDADFNALVQQAPRMAAKKAQLLDVFQKTGVKPSDVAAPLLDALKAQQLSAKSKANASAPKLLSGGGKSPVPQVYKPSGGPKSVRQAMKEAREAAKSMGAEIRI